jgi:hypothetical protein
MRSWPGRCPGRPGDVRRPVVLGQGHGPGRCGPGHCGGSGRCGGPGRCGCSGRCSGPGRRSGPARRIEGGRCSTRGRCRRRGVSEERALGCRRPRMPRPDHAWTCRPGRRLAARRCRPGRGPDGPTDQQQGAGRALEPYRVRRPRHLASRTSATRTSATRTTALLAGAARTRAYQGNVTRTNAGRSSAYRASVPRTGLCRGSRCWRHPPDRAHPSGGCGRRTPSRLRGARRFPGRGRRLHQRPSAGGEAPGAVRRAGPDVLPPAGCPTARCPLDGGLCRRRYGGLRQWRGPGRRRNGGLRRRGGPGRRRNGGLRRRGGPGRRRNGGLRGSGGPGFRERFGRGYILLNLPRSARRAASPDPRRLLHGPWVSRIPQSRLPTSSFNTTQTSEEGRSTVSGSDPLQACPAASYSPTRSPAQYHRR